MKKIKIRFSDPQDMRGARSFVRPYMALCGREEDGSLFQLHGWAHCRESIIGYARAKYVNTPYNARCTMLATDRTRVMLYAKQTTDSAALLSKKRLAFENALKNAVKILNFFEKEGGLKLSVLYQIEHTLAKSNLAYLIEGSAEWQRAPALLSLYLLLIRCGRFPELGNFTTFDEFIERCTFVIKDFDTNTANLSAYQKANYPCAFPTGDPADTDYLRLIANKLLVIMKNRKELFSKTPAKKFYENCSNVDGIYKLCRGSISNKELAENFVELCDAYEIEADKPFM